MTPINILILTANPTLEDQAPLRLSAEVRQVEEVLQRSKYRDQFKVTTKLAVRSTDLQQALLDLRPQIVHFSGHGSGEMGLLLETDTGKQQLVRTEALAQLFEVFSAGEIECVLLNACYSEDQAKAIHQFVDCVIGMNQPIGDKAGKSFAEGFYRGLGAGLGYDEAYKMGRSAISLSGSRDQAVPVLMYRRPDAIAPALRVEADSAPLPEPVTAAPPVSSGQSQSFGNITISGSDNDFNTGQAGGDVTIDQSRTQTTVANPELQMALEAVEKLKQAIAATDEVGGTDKKMAAIPIQELEEELQKPEPKQSAIDQAIAALKKTLDGAIVLAEPVAEVAKLVAKVGIFLV